MTPQSNTLFSVCLFLALCALNAWTARRGRLVRRPRAGAQEGLPGCAGAKRSSRGPGASVVPGTTAGLPQAS
jgi:hypothetical protein